MIGKQKLHFLIERFFIISGLIILTATMLAGLYFNKYDEEEKRKNNLQKIHGMLSQLMVPSLIISDFSEVKRLLFMASSNKETYLVIDNDGTIIMPDYDKSHFSNFVSAFYKSTNDCKNLEATYRYIGNTKYLINCSILKNSDVLSDGKSVGALLSFSNYKWFSFSPIILYFVGILIVLFITLIFLFRKLLYRQLLQPLVTLKNSISSISMDWALQNSHIDEINNAPSELVEIKEAFERLLLSLHEEYRWRFEAEKMKALIDLAAGVAHDIRSPLIALDIIIRDIKNIPEEQRIVIRNSANRINDIANNLLTQYKQRKNLESDDDSIKNTKPELISDLLMSLISEKRAQHRNDAIKLTMNMDESAYGKFAMISASTFNRVLSNLIDNSIEASADHIKLELSIFGIEQQSRLLIQIQDNGCGISSETLNKIMNGESISSKAKGHGLGLPHANKTIENEWGGRFNLRSSKDVGTTAEIQLPQTSTPKWFLSKLMINPKDTIVILDDDESIHQVWEKRFNEVSSDLKLINHYSPQDLLTWEKSNLAGTNIFLIDYEFIGCKENGLNIIEKLNIADRSYLVTSRHEDIHVREGCEKIGLKIIPKTFAVYIPIVLLKINNRAVDLIFIDDETAITDAWVLHGLTKRKVIAAYNSVRDFKTDVNKYDLNTPIYIDSDLNDVVTGQEYAKQLFAIGFKYIHLATGHSPDNFQKMYWIKEVVGKAPPF